MPHQDHLCRGLVPRSGLRASFVRISDTARMARVLHGLYPAAALVFGEALAAGALLGSLQKDSGRINLQLECDGPLAGLLVDGDADGNVRGYVRRPEVHFPGDPAAAARAALGQAGFLSVIRDHGGGHFYRSSVKLEAMDLAGDLRRWFESSEQVATAFDLAVVPSADGAEPLGEVAGLVIQRLPDGDDAAVAAARARLAAGALPAALRRGATAHEILTEVAGNPFELLADQEVAYRCGCSKQRARVAVSSLGVDGIADVLQNEKQAVITCEFCRERYVIDEAELREIQAKLSEQQADG
ncbi:MAG: Hsp33 family molecular chaperone HslO [Anaeromyxobacter sp.]